MKSQVGKKFYTDIDLSNKQNAVFLDRDGTITKEVGLACGIDRLELLPGVAEAVKKINKSGYYCIVVTNQPAIARGIMTESELSEVNDWLIGLLKAEDAHIDAVYYCPHEIQEGSKDKISDFQVDCNCHKPKPGMLLEAAKDFKINLENSWMIGDTENDIKAGKNACCKTALIGLKRNLGQDLWADNLLDAVNFIL